MELGIYALIILGGAYSKIYRGGQLEASIAKDLGRCHNLLVLID